MLRFRLGSIPVVVQPSHFVLSAVMGLSGEGGTGAQLVLGVVTWMFVVFVSVLVHELGHAVAARRFGYQPSIELVWLGGVTRPNAPEAIPWGRDVLLTLAGPFAGASLGLICRLARGIPGLPPAAEQLLQTFFWANVGWAVLNLVPVPPLDGGHVSMAVLRRVLGRRGETLAWALGAACGALLAWGGTRLGLTTVAILFALLGFQAGAAALASSRRGAAPSDGQRRLDEAQRLLDAGQLDEARALAEGVGASEDPLVRSGSERILGWVALKRGEGRSALDHFSQVQKVRVEPHALAAAFSLVGDEERALQLWELAYRELPSPLVLHEWAGALIRAGRTDTALALSGVQPAQAFACAERVLFLRGEFAAAARVGEEGLERAPTAEAAYDAACAHARAGQVDDALRLLRRAVTLGFRNMDFARSDADLAAVHGHPEWNALLRTLTESASR